MADSSSTSSSERPLRARSLLAVVLATALGLELFAGRVYQAPVPILTKAEAFAAQAHAPGDQVVIMGTCLPEQTIALDRLASMLGQDTRVLNLAAPATGPQVWARVVDHYIPDDADVKAIIVPYGPGELSTLTSPWENPAFELASWSDMPFIIEHSCRGQRCATDLILRRTSAAWRYRERLAQPFWSFLGTPGSAEAPRPGPQADGPGLAPPLPPPPGSGPRPGDLAGHTRIDATGAPIRGREVAPGAALPAEASGSSLGWNPRSDRIEYSAMDPASLVWMEDFLAQAAERGIPVFLVPLPSRDDTAAGPTDRIVDSVYDEAVKSLADAPGVTRVELATRARLRPEHFEDDVHLTREGRDVATQLLAERLTVVLGTEQR